MSRSALDWQRFADANRHNGLQGTLCDSPPWACGTALRMMMLRSSIAQQTPGGTLRRTTSNHAVYRRESSVGTLEIRRPISESKFEQANIGVDRAAADQRVQGKRITRRSVSDAWFCCFWTRARLVTKTNRNTRVFCDRLGKGVKLVLRLKCVPRNNVRFDSGSINKQML